MRRGELRMIADVPEIAGFIERHKGDPRANGKLSHRNMRAKEIVNGYSYRFDAVRWCKQAMIPWAVARELGAGDILVWLDADVVTFNSVPGDFVETLLGDDAIVYLGREPKYSEIGFIAFRIPDALPAIEAYAGFYAGDSVFDLPEWHSGYVFDCARRSSGVLGRSLTAPGSRGHVWFDTPLGLYTDHTKGDRKRLGRSPERPAA